MAKSAEQFALGMDFRFLYNTQRRLFAIGYNLEDGRLDRSHYDMLCSEARLQASSRSPRATSRPRHWFQLGRQATITAGPVRPALVGRDDVRVPHAGAVPAAVRRLADLAQACRAAVARQKEYGRQLGVPWGVSESAFGALAANLDYHYQSFGVPGLGFKRGLSEDLVVAPYATMLSLPIDPQTASPTSAGWSRKAAWHAGASTTRSISPRTRSRRQAVRCRSAATWPTIREWASPRSGTCCWRTSSSGGSTRIRSIRARELLLAGKSPGRRAGRLAARRRNGRSEDRVDPERDGQSPDERLAVADSAGRICCRTAATRSWSPTPAAATACSATWR